MIELTVQDEDRKWSYRITEQSKVTIGRAPTNEIQIKEVRSSRLHCQIEKTEAGYKLVDLESRNGTRVNGETVNTRLLKPGDRVQIGGTEILFGKAASTAAAAAPREEAEESPPLQTVRLEKRPSHRVAPRRQAQVPWNLFGLAGLVLFALIVVTFVYNYMESTRKRERLYEEAEGVFAKVEKEITPEGRLARMKEAIRAYEEVTTRYPGTEESSRASSRLEGLRPAYENLERWYKKLNAILHLKRIEDSTPSMQQLMDWEEQLRAIEKNCPIGSLAAQAGFEREGMEEEAKKAVERLIEDQRRKVEGTLIGEDYYRALLQWELFKETYDRFPAVVKTAKEEIASVEAKAAAAFETLEGEVDLLLEKERFTEARALLERAREKYVGTETAARASMKAQVVSMMSRGEKTRGKAEQYVEENREVFLNAAEAEGLAKRLEFEKASRIYRDILDATQDPTVKREFGRRLEEMKAIQGLFDTFIRKASSGALKGKEWSIGAGAVVEVSDADAEWVYFTLPGKSGSTQKRWKSFETEDLVSLLGLGISEGETLFVLGLFCFRNGLEETGEEVLVEALGASEDLRPRINEVIARVRGESVPEGGYVVYKGGWYTRAERERAMEDDRIASLVETILKKPVSRISGAVGRLSAMKRGRPKLVEALREKREILKKKMAGDLNIDNRTLVALKKELDKRRAEALDFIEDETRYPDLKKMRREGREGEYWKIQHEQVDPRVEAVREIWENPYTAALKLNPASKAINEDLKKVNEWLAREDEDFDPEKADEVDTDYIATLANAKMSIKTFSPVRKEQKLIAFNQAVMEWNAKNETASPTERKQVKITNEYRWMLGRRCVKIEDILTKVARGHSKYMADTGKFAHRIPGEPAGETPHERCTNAGYSGGATGENISYNHTSPRDTFIAWYNSAGHHRNMIKRDWSVMGAGLHGAYWTQNFGSNDSTRGKPGSPSGGGWPGTAWRGGKAKRKG